jgi:hypothetical protein
MMKFLATLLIGFAVIAPRAAAQSGIRPPQVGFAGNADGTLRPVYGVAGNFILGPSIAARVISQAFSGSIGLLKTESTLEAFNGQGQMLAATDAAEGPALFAFSPDGLTALAYVPSSNTLVQWKGGQLVTLPLHPGLGTVLAIALTNPLEASLIVQREGGIWETRFSFTQASPASQKALVGVTAPVLALASGGLVFSDTNGFVLRNPNGAEVHIAAQVPAQFSMQQMAGNWLQVNDLDNGRRFAIRIAAGREGFYRLPQPLAPKVEH